MVFILQSDNEHRLLGPNQIYTVGRSRKNHINLKTAKASLSHAKIEVQEENAVIEDLNTNEGTFVNSKKISKPTVIRSGDKVSFGPNCKYCFQYVRMNTTIDKQISKDLKEEMIDALHKLKIKYLDEFLPGNCIYLIDVITREVLKEKTIIWALLAKNRVVTPKYIKDILDNIQEAPRLPNYYRYSPQIDPQLTEKGITEVTYSAKRRKLFKSLTFILFERDDDLFDLIICCGGVAIDYSKKSDFCHSLTDKSTTYIAINPFNDKRKQLSKITNLLSELQRKNVTIYSIFVDDIYISIVSLDVTGVLPATQTYTGKTDKRSEPEVDIVCGMITKNCQIPRSFSKLEVAHSQQDKWISRPTSHVKPTIKVNEKVVEDISSDEEDGVAQHDGGENRGKSLEKSEQRSQHVEVQKDSNQLEMCINTDYCSIVENSQEILEKRVCGSVDQFESCEEDSEIVNPANNKQKQSSKSRPLPANEILHASNKELIDIIKTVDKQLEAIEEKRSGTSKSSSSSPGKRSSPEEESQSRKRKPRLVVNPISAANKKIKLLETTPSTSVADQPLNEPNRKTGKELQEWQRKFKNFKIIPVTKK